MLLILIAASLVARSASDIWMIQSVTIIESTIIQMDRRKFIQTLMKYMSALPLVWPAFDFQSIFFLQKCAAMCLSVLIFVNFKRSTTLIYFQ